MGKNTVVSFPHPVFRDELSDLARQGAQQIIRQAVDAASQRRLSWLRTAALMMNVSSVRSSSGPRVLTSQPAFTTRQFSRRFGVARTADRERYPERGRSADGCGRICVGKRKINISTVFAGQIVGVREVEDQIWLVSFLDYDLAFFDKDEGRVEPAPDFRTGIIVTIRIGIADIFPSGNKYALSPPVIHKYSRSVILLPRRGVPDNITERE